MQNIWEITVLSMYEYSKIVFFIYKLFGNEFTLQMFLFALLYIPVLKKRKLFYVRYPACWLIVIGLQVLRTFGYLPIPDAVNYFLIVLMLAATNFICFQSNAMQALFVSVCIYGSQHIISNIAYIFIYLLIWLKGNWDLFQYYIVAMPVITAAGMAATYFLPVRQLKKKEKLKFNNLVVYYEAIAFVIVATTFSHYGRYAIMWSPEGLVYLLTIASFFTASTMSIGFMNISKTSLEEENAILQELLHKDEQRYEQAKLSNEKIQIKYHDMKRRTHQGIVDYESLKEVEPDSEILKSTYFSGNRALDVILSEKALMCERLGINFICTADGQAVNFMKPHHIYSLVGNALENAIESLKDEQDEAVKELTVEIVRREGTCIFKTENFVREKVEISDGIPVTNKSDKENHGFGVKSMRNIVLTYGGQISFYEQNNIFTMLAIIPIPE